MKDEYDVVELLEKHSLAVIIMCFTLFVLTAGIGYVLCGLIFANHIMKKDPDAYAGSGLLGAAVIWPAAILIYELEKRHERKNNEKSD